MIPLLFETGAENELDATICVACSEATQRERLLERNWNPEQIQRRIQAQWPIEKKLAKADYVIWTEWTIEITAQQLERILPVSPRFFARPSPGSREVVTTYTVLGIEHILTGFDHLLYILAMLILVGGWRRIVVTMSACGTGEG